MHSAKSIPTPSPADMDPDNHMDTQHLDRPYRLVENAAARRTRGTQRRLKLIQGIVVNKKKKEVSLAVRWVGREQEIDLVPLKVLRNAYCRQVFDFFIDKLKFKDEQEKQQQLHPQTTHPTPVHESELEDDYSDDDINNIARRKQTPNTSDLLATSSEESSDD